MLASVTKINFLISHYQKKTVKEEKSGPDFSLCVSKEKKTNLMSLDPLSLGPWPH